MAETHVMSALRDKYSQLLGELKKCDQTADQLRTDLAHVEAAIRLFKPDWDESTASGKRPRKPSRWPKSGQGIKTALDVLRTADRPMTAHDITIECMTRCGLPTDDATTVKAVAAGLRGGLMKRAGKTVIRHDGFPKRWSIDR